jgi:hypothetical protein
MNYGKALKFIPFLGLIPASYYTLENMKDRKKCVIQTL